MGYSNFDPNRLAKDMQKSMDGNPEYQAGQKTYKRAIAKGLGIIGIAVFLFVAAMFYVSVISLSYALWLCLGAAVILVGAILYATVIIRRAQAEYMGGAVDAAGKAAEELKKQIRDR